jgi:hypothetical protein
MARAATDYTQRTGIDGFGLSPLQLRFAQRVLDQRERLDRLRMARAMEAAFVAAHGGEVDWNKL